MMFFDPIDPLLESTSVHLYFCTFVPPCHFDIMTPVSVNDLTRCQYYDDRVNETVLRHMGSCMGSFHRLM